MSYEGYVEYLCEKGHYFSFDCYDDPDKPACPRCGGPPVWKHSVDQTNGEVLDDSGKPYPETAPYPLEVERYILEVVRIPVYKIPKKNKRKK